jgi:predicted branched-subunit amino acid permease
MNLSPLTSVVGKLSAPAFRQGFKAMLPFWLSAGPVALAYVLAARNAGLSDFQIQLMSLTVYSSAAQIAMVQLLAGGASALTIFATAVVINVHQIVYGFSLTRHLTFTRLEKALAAFALTDATYGITIAAKENRSVQFLFGAECSIYMAWNMLTCAALLAGQILAAFKGLPLDFLVPLTFFVLLIGLVETPIDLTVVLYSVVFAIFLVLAGLGEYTVIMVSITGPLVGLGIGQIRNAKPRFHREQE